PSFQRLAPDIGAAAASIKVTARPLRARYSAVEVPMIPAPSTATRFCVPFADAFTSDVLTICLDGRHRSSQSRGVSPRPNWRALRRTLPGLPADGSPRTGGAARLAPETARFRVAVPDAVT